MTAHAVSELVAFDKLRSWMLLKDHGVAYMDFRESLWLQTGSLVTLSLWN